MFLVRFPALPQPAAAPRKRKRGKEGRKRSRQGREQRGRSLWPPLLNSNPLAWALLPTHPWLLAFAQKVCPPVVAGSLRLTEPWSESQGSPSCPPPIQSSSQITGAVYTNAPYSGAFNSSPSKLLLHPLTEGFPGQTPAPGFPASGPKTPYTLVSLDCQPHFLLSSYVPGMISLFFLLPSPNISTS